MQASQKGGYVFSPVHIHLSSHMYAITNIQVTDTKVYEGEH